MTARRLYVVNLSTLITDDEVKRMVTACNKQVRDHAAPAWGVGRIVVSTRKGASIEAVQQAAPAGSWVIGVLDNPDDPGALGWHSESDTDHVYGEIFAKPSLDAGSTALTGTYAVSSVLSHEVLETLCDPFCNGWDDTGRGYLLAREVCDPVEADGYEIDGVTVSNFVLPEWFDAVTSAGEKFDYLGKLTQPFAMTPGGYWVQMPAGQPSQRFKRTAEWLTEVGFDVHGKGTGPQAVFSPEVPEWRRELKMRFGRNAIKRGIAA